MQSWENNVCQYSVSNRRQKKPVLRGNVVKIANWNKYGYPVKPLCMYFIISCYFGIFLSCVYLLHVSMKICNSTKKGQSVVNTNKMHDRSHLLLSGCLPLQSISIMMSHPTWETAYAKCLYFQEVMKKKGHVVILKAGALNHGLMVLQQKY